MVLGLSTFMQKYCAFGLCSCSRTFSATFSSFYVKAFAINKKVNSHCFLHTTISIRLCILLIFEENPNALSPLINTPLITLLRYIRKSETKISERLSLRNSGFVPIIYTTDSARDFFVIYSTYLLMY